MKLSKRGEYGIRALCHLAVRHDQGVIHIASWRARAAELSLGSEALINTYPDPVGLVLGIDPDIVIGEEIPSLTREEAVESEG